MSRLTRIQTTFFAAVVCLLVASGCGAGIESEVVLGATVEQDIAAPMLGAFYRSEEGRVSPKARFGIDFTDLDAFTSEITGETDGFVADVIWSDDIFLMTDLSRRGLLASHDWKTEPTFAAGMMASDRTWRAFAATARVLIVNTDLLKNKNDYPQSVDEIADPRWSKRCAMAIPTNGAAAIHAGIIGQLKGIEAASQWFKATSTNAMLMKRDAEVATAVAKGQLDWGLTSSADAVAEQDAANPIAIIFPDQSPGKPGTVQIPHAVAVMKTAPHPIAAAKLADYLVLPSTEDRLAMSDAAQIPLSRLATFKPRVLTGASVRWAEVDFQQASLAYDELKPILETLFSPPVSRD